MTVDQLHRIMKRGDLSGLESALDAGVDVESQYKNGATLLMLAASIGNTVIGKLLIDRGACLDARTCYGQSQFQFTALAYAAISGKPSFVQILLESGASLDASPHPGTFESYIDWLDKYGRATPEQLGHIRTLIAAERLKRSNSSSNSNSVIPDP